jgi:hypothetical protein
LDLFIALLLKPLIALVVFGVPCALALVFVRRLSDGWLKRLLLTNIHSGNRRNRSVKKPH